MSNVRFFLYVCAVALMGSAAACGGDPPLEPDPGAGPEVQLARATTVGRAFYPVGNWPQGGHGQPISGVACIITNPPPPYHVHAHSVFS